MSELVEFVTMTGERKMIPREQVKERTSAYVFVMRGREILFVNTKTTGKKWVLGGGVEPGESVEEALRREVKEEAGIEISDIAELYEDEVNFYYEPQDAAWHNRLKFFTAHTFTNNVVDREAMLQDEETERPHWVNVDAIKIEDLQPALDRIFPLVRDEIRRRMSDGGISAL